MPSVCLVLMHALSTMYIVQGAADIFNDVEAFYSAIMRYGVRRTDRAMDNLVSKLSVDFKYCDEVNYDALHCVEAADASDILEQMVLKQYVSGEYRVSSMQVIPGSKNEVKVDVEFVWTTKSGDKIKENKVETLIWSKDSSLQQLTLQDYHRALSGASGRRLLWQKGYTSKTVPTNKPTASPTNKPTKSPTNKPTGSPTKKPTHASTNKPTKAPTNKPTKAPTNKPTLNPTGAPTTKPTNSPTKKPTNAPTNKPTPSPIMPACEHPGDLDIIFLVDCSVKVHDATCPKLDNNEFLAELYSAIKGVNNVVRAGYISYGNGMNSIKVDISLTAVPYNTVLPSTLTNMVDVYNKIRKLQCPATMTPGSVDIDGALKAAYQQFKTVGKSDTVGRHKKIVLITNNHVDKKEQIKICKHHQNKLKKHNVELIHVKLNKDAVKDKKYLSCLTQSDATRVFEPLPSNKCNLNTLVKPIADKSCIKPTPAPTRAPTLKPTAHPTPAPTKKPTGHPTVNPTASPTNKPTKSPTKKPTHAPTNKPTANPTMEPTVEPTLAPTDKPTANPTAKPTAKPTPAPTGSPTNAPTKRPTYAPTKKPTNAPTNKPTLNPTGAPTKKPTNAPTNKPTANPTMEPTVEPTAKPTPAPTGSPTKKPTNAPTKKPTNAPTKRPTKKPTNNPTNAPTKKPIYIPVKQQQKKY